MPRLVRIVFTAACFCLAPGLLFWIVGFGDDGDVVWLIAVLLGVLVALIAMAMLPWPGATKAALALGLAVAQVGLLWLAVLGGRKFFFWRMVHRLDEYQAVADEQLSRLSREGRTHRSQDRPHPDLTRADATIFADGSSLVRLTLRRSPRTMTLLLPSRHVLPAVDERGRCLETVSGVWKWYARC